MKYIKLINLALLFTTRLPGLPVKDYTEKELGQSGIFFPLIGLLIGGLLYGEYLLFADVNITAKALLLITTGILITGGLHLDGFMDTMDGVMSGASGEKMLAIMSDSNVGAHSVSMLMVLLLSKAALFIELLPTAPILLLLLPFVGRLIMLLCIVLFPYAKKKGIGLIYKSNLTFSSVLVITLLSTGLLYYIKPLYVFAFFLCFIALYCFAQSIVKKINGLTGDVYGSTAEISEVVFLLIILILNMLIGR